MKVRELSKQDILKSYRDYATVGDLVDFIHKHNIPRTAKVLIQRVEDVYYENNGWGVYLKEGDYCNYLRRMNQHPDKIFHSTEKEIKQASEQYTPAWSPCLYKEDKNDFLFIDLHY